MKTIDINCDMGESFGRYTLGNDEELMKSISSANIACGFHAGDPLVIQKTVRMARAQGVAIGAHPGYPDLQGFGRRVMKLSVSEVEALVLYQVGALAGFARAERGELTHVKPHGALYNQASVDIELARAIAQAVRQFSKSLVLVGLAGSKLIDAGLEAGLRVAAEGFPERGYLPDGGLMERGQPGAIIHDPIHAAQQAYELASNGLKVKKDNSGSMLAIETLCIHGDSPQAVAIACAIKERLETEGYRIKPLKL